MNKLTLVTMATLCLLLFSCSGLEQEVLLDSEIALESRSSSNPIVVKYLSALGVNKSVVCTHAEVTFSNPQNADILLVLEDETILSDSGSDLEFAKTDGYAFSAFVDQNEITVSQLHIDLCSPQFCYTNSDGSLSGTGLEFIVEDENIGI